MNAAKTTLLLGAMTAIFVVIGNYFGGSSGMVIGLAFALIMNVGSYWFSDKIVLKMYKAREVSEGESPQLYSMVKSLTQSADLPMPKVYVVPSDSPNAFATGRNPSHAAVAVTEGLIRNLDQHEVQGVLAHEVAHIKHRDILISTVAATLAGAIMVMANMARFAAIFGGGGGSGRDDRGGGLGLIVTAILAPVAALLIQMAISRSREYAADAEGAALTGNPNGLASALQKIAALAGRRPMRGASPQTAHMFIVNPFSGKSLASLFSTHPPMEERVKRLLGS